jgi:AraC family transcriptional regulator
MDTEILIKGMVCIRCISVINEGIIKLGHKVNRISLGKIIIDDNLSNDKLLEIESFLGEQGFELISNRQVKLIRQVKQLIQNSFNTKRAPKLKFSTLLSEELHMNYDSISALFSETEGITIEKYFINKRLEKVKELLVYSDLTLTAIASKTGFGGINHLSAQFKDLTGLTPSHFKKIRTSKQKLSARPDL